MAAYEYGVKEKGINGEFLVGDVASHRSAL
jgi:hypothetical protein